MRQQTGKVTAQLKLKTLNDNPYNMALPNSQIMDKYDSIKYPTLGKAEALY